MMRAEIKSELREELIKSCGALVTHIVNKERSYLFAGGYGDNDSFTFDELHAEGYIGLCKAADNFDPNMGAKFSTYAHIRIRGHIQDYVRKEKKQLMAKNNALSKPINYVGDFTDRIAFNIDLKRGIEQLSEEEKEILKAYVECSSDIDEAAALLDLPVNEAVDILLSGKRKIRRAITSTDRVWHEIPFNVVVEICRTKYKIEDPEEALKKYWQEIKQKRREMTTTHTPEDFYWFELGIPELKIVVDPLNRRFSVIENNMPDIYRN